MDRQDQATQEERHRQQAGVNPQDVRETAYIDQTQILDREN
jgi:hypothetical protein